MAALRGPKKSIQSEYRIPSFLIGRPRALSIPASSSNVASRHEGCSALIFDAEGRHHNDGRIYSGAGSIVRIGLPAAIRVITVMAAVFAPGRQRLPVQMSGPSKALAGGNGRHARNAQECRDANGDRPDD